MKINWHNYKMIALTVIMFAIGGISAFKGSDTGMVTSILAALTFLEHTLQGNITPAV